MPERSGATELLIERTCRDGAPSDPILWLRRLPDGPMFCLDDYQYEGKPRPWISVGFGEFRDIEIPDKTVSKLHCLLYRDPATRRLFVEDAQSLNGTIVNGAVPLEDGVVELVAGSCLSVGGVTLLACGRAGEEQEPIVMGAGLHACFRYVIALYGSLRKAAGVLGVPHSTFQRWWKRKKFCKTASADDAGAPQAEHG